MEKILINGGKRLDGTISLQGSKNAALPIIFATIATRGISTLDNLPDIGDVNIALKILEDFGAVIERSKNSVQIDTRKLVYKTPREEYVSKIRASTYLIGAGIARFSRAELMNFGGCNFGRRPIDIHLSAAESLGAVLDGNLLYTKELKPAKITLAKPSVGATINAIIMASAISGTTVLYNYALEPHVMALIDFMRMAGADIIAAHDGLYITGAELHGANVEIIPDMIEAGTYMLLSPMLGGRVCVPSCVLASLSSYLAAISVCGINTFGDGEWMYFSGIPSHHIKVITEPYPGFPTDLQPQLCPLMAAFCGGEIEERVWCDRFGYLDALKEFGIVSEKSDSCARVHPSEIKPAQASAPDLRGGAACMIAALAAKGRSVIYRPDIILRGYSNLVENLISLGADVKIV